MPNVPSHDVHSRPALQGKPLPDVVALSVFDTILPIAGMCAVSAINTPGVSDQITQEATGCTGYWSLRKNPTSETLRVLFSKL